MPLEPFDDAVQPDALVHDVHERSIDVLIFERRPMAGQHFGVAADGGQRRPQFVRDESEELVFRRVCSAQFGRDAARVL